MEKHSEKVVSQILRVSRATRSKRVHSESGRFSYQLGCERLRSFQWFVDALVSFEFIDGVCFCFSLISLLRVEKNHQAGIDILSTCAVNNFLWRLGVIIRWSVSNLFDPTRNCTPSRNATTRLLYWTPTALFWAMNCSFIRLGRVSKTSWCGEDM